MPVTLIALLEIKDQEKLAAYRAKAGDYIKKYGGSVLAAGPLNQTLEGTSLAAETAAILSFPDMEAVQGWYNDPDFSDTHLLRQQAGISTISIINPPAQ